MGKESDGVTSENQLPPLYQSMVALSRERGGLPWSAPAEGAADLGLRQQKGQRKSAGRRGQICIEGISSGTVGVGLLRLCRTGGMQDAQPTCLIRQSQIFV